MTELQKLIIQKAGCDVLNHAITNLKDIEADLERKLSEIQMSLKGSGRNSPYFDRKLQYARDLAVTLEVISKM